MENIKSVNCCVVHKKSVTDTYMLKEPEDFECFVRKHIKSGLIYTVFSTKPCTIYIPFPIMNSRRSLNYVEKDRSLLHRINRFIRYFKIDAYELPGPQALPAKRLSTVYRFVFNYYLL